MDSAPVAQRYAFQQFQMGKNLLITGPAGTGKSFFIARCKEYADENKIPFHITATTGAAAVLLHSSAKTINSWAGINIGKDPVNKIYNKLKYKQQRAFNMMREPSLTLVIDEISMFSEHMFDLTSEVLSSVRDDPRPFGGVQVILCGDFYQLCPVSEQSNPALGNFCFHSKIFKEMFTPEQKNLIEFDVIFRQLDPVFTRVLNEIRIGEVSSESDAILRTRLKVKPDPDADITPTRIYSRREAVDNYNDVELEKIPSKPEMFKMKEVFETSEEEVCKQYGIKQPDLDREFSFLRKSLLCDDEITLKVGAQVMNIRNTSLGDDTILANGAQGVVISIIANEKGEVVPVVKFHNGMTMQVSPKFFESSNYKHMGVCQIPIRLSWAITIHKSQGCSLDFAEIDLGSSVFAFGQTYSAVSRVRTLEGLFITAYDPSKILAHPEVKNFYKQFVSITEADILPEQELQASIKKEKMVVKKLAEPVYNRRESVVTLFSDDSHQDHPKKRAGAFDVVTAKKAAVTPFPYFPSADGKAKPVVTLLSDDSVKEEKVISFDKFRYQSLSK